VEQKEKYTLTPELELLAERVPTSENNMAPDHSHDHEWRPELNDPILEDGAAIFQQKCDYAEGRWGERWECEETRHYRFEMSWFEEKATRITYLASEINRLLMKWELAIMDVERNGEIVAIDPDEDYGYVTAETDEWRVKYKADRQPQIDS